MILFQGRVDPATVVRRIPLAVTPTRIVPCGTCTLCCKGGQVVVLFPEAGDVIDAYQTEPAPHVSFLGDDVQIGRAMLAHRENGDCVYLGPKGCTIHDRRPAVCREFDCADMWRKTPRWQRKRMVRDGHLDPAIFNRGRELALQSDKENPDGRIPHPA